LNKRDPDPPLVVPHRTAAADELVALDQQREGGRQVGALGKIDRSAARGQIADGAGNAVTVEGDRRPFSTLYRLAARFSTIVTNPKCRLDVRPVTRADYGALNRTFSLRAQDSAFVYDTPV
jgi:hypothetical protein